MTEIAAFTPTSRRAARQQRPLRGGVRRRRSRRRAASGTSPSWPAWTRGWTRSPILGLANGEAHIIRNAGGVITDDVIRSLCLSQRFLGTREIVLRAPHRLRSAEGGRGRVPRRARGRARRQALVVARVLHRPLRRRAPVDPAALHDAVRAPQGPHPGLRLRRHRRPPARGGVGRPGAGRHNPAPARDPGPPRRVASGCRPWARVAGACSRASDGFDRRPDHPPRPAGGIIKPTAGGGTVRLRPGSGDGRAVSRCRRSRPAGASSVRPSHRASSVGRAARCCGRPVRRRHLLQPARRLRPCRGPPETYRSLTGRLARGLDAKRGRPGASVGARAPGSRQRVDDAVGA